MQQRRQNYSRTSGDLLTSGRNTDDRANTPPFVASLQRRAHDMHIACAVERVVQTAISDLDEMVLDALALGELSRVDELVRAELLRPGFLAWIRVDRDDT